MTDYHLVTDEDEQATFNNLSYIKD